MSELQLSHKQTADFELLANGGFAPLEGFQGSEAWKTVVDDMRLPDGSRGRSPSRSRPRPARWATRSS